MAGSRLYKIGTIFSRTQGLLKSGAMKPEDKPLWYDVYEAFPPKVEPRFDRKEATNEIRSIFYEEDIVRAKFYKKLGNVGAAMNMFEDNEKVSVCQLFVEEYQKRKIDTNILEDELFSEVVAYLESQGISLDRHSKKEETRSEKVPSTSTKLSEIYSECKEQQE